MKKILFLSLIFASCALMGQSVKVVYDFNTFHSVQGNYVEIHSSIAAASLQNVASSEGKWLKQAELTTVICGADRPDSAVYVDKRIIKSPEVSDSNNIRAVSLLDVQRVLLDNGDYVVYFDLKDIAKSKESLQYKDAFKINFPKDNVSLSDIVIVDTIADSKTPNMYTRGTKDIIPNIFGSLSLQENTLKYYVEIYNADKTFGKDNMYAIVTNLENATTNRKVDNIQLVKRMKAGEVSTYVGALDVSSLVEGTYYLNVEIRNGENILYEYKRKAFYKESEKKPDVNNMELPNDVFVNYIADSTLDDNLYSLLPIASENERYHIQKTIKNGNNDQKRYILYEFFMRLNTTSPEYAWKEYSKAVSYVNKKYSTKIRKGYDTDMGRVYLLYGEPDDIIDSKFGASSGFNNVNEQYQKVNGTITEGVGVNYYPYQIWIYNSTPFGESNRKFVFYARENNLIEYYLLHSNAKGENQDMFWEHTLSRGTLEQGIEGKAGKQFRTGHE